MPILAQSRAEDDMRSIITVVIVAAVAAVTTAWSISISSPGPASRGQVMFGGSNAVPTQTFVLW